VDEGAVSGGISPSPVASRHPLPQGEGVYLVVEFWRTHNLIEQQALFYIDSGFL
jgi:hypothetical protein